ncbi:hypothetical protein RchiOBHm_Chr5g0055841 [Rosa chinensis]|uniref:Uncharacterized protein n=1 Tax=Rosa chinensis TaxID=74649 RepID=A0A2P6QGH2_ROSCH|nr:hypothetical protein RchiOBHm_Chr5g0055841 [Rosa chinensis]
MDAVVGRTLLLGDRGPLYRGGFALDRWDRWQVVGEIRVVGWWWFSTCRWTLWVGWAACLGKKRAGEMGFVAGRILDGQIWWWIVDPFWVGATSPRLDQGWVDFWIGVWAVDLWRWRDWVGGLPTMVRDNRFWGALMVEVRRKWWHVRNTGTKVGVVQELGWACLVDLISLLFCLEVGFGLNFGPCPGCFI